MMVLLKIRKNKYWTAAPKQVEIEQNDINDKVVNFNIKYLF